MNKKVLHPNCITYRKMIVEHQNYNNLPEIITTIMILDGLQLEKVNWGKKEKNGG